MMNGLYVGQTGQFYSVYTPQGILIAQVFCGGDGQYMQDVSVMNLITKALARRWGVK